MTHLGHIQRTEARGKCAAFENASSQASEVFKASSVSEILPAVCVTMHLHAIPNKSLFLQGKVSVS